MQSPVVTASLVALSLLGQPVGAAWCAVQCHSADAARIPAEDHCRSAVTRDAASNVLTSGVAFCDHGAMVLTTTLERAQLVRPAQAASAPVTRSVQPQVGVHLRRVIHNQGPPGVLAAPLPLRI
jgi:hypothetical protein